MISLRYHIVSIAAVFLALAVGVVLGSTALNGALLSGLSDEKGKLASQVSDLEAQRNALNARLSDADAFAGSLGPKVVAGALDRRSVVLVTTQEANPADRDALRQLIEASGARVSGELQLTDSFTDPAKADQLRQVVTRLQPAGSTFPTAGDPGTLAGALVGSVLLLNKDTAQPQSTTDELAAAIAGLQDGGFANASPVRRAAGPLRRGHRARRGPGVGRRHRRDRLRAGRHLGDVHSVHCGQREHGGRADQRRAGAQGTAGRRDRAVRHRGQRAVARARGRAAGQLTTAAARRGRPGGQLSSAASPGLRVAARRRGQRSIAAARRAPPRRAAYNDLYPAALSHQILGDQVRGDQVPASRSTTGIAASSAWALTVT